jgi:hypothetical protein
MGIFEDMETDLMASLDDVVESVFYSANGAAEIEIDANVFRNIPIEADGQRGPAKTNNQITVWVLSSDVPVVTIGKDTIRFKKNIDDTSYTTLTVRRIEDQAPGSFTLRVS